MFRSEGGIRIPFLTENAKPYGMISGAIRETSCRSRSSRVPDRRPGRQLRIVPRSLTGITHVVWVLTYMISLTQSAGHRR